jgi:hypothetical protein
MRLRGIVIVMALAALPACGNTNTNIDANADATTDAKTKTDANGDTDARNDAGSTSSFPAPEPADVCSLLTLADVQSIVPTAVPGVGGTGAPNSDIWGIECDWEGSSSSVSLLVEGAKAPAALGVFDLAIQGVEVATTGVQIMPISDLGDEAVYFNDTRMNAVKQELQAASGKYWVGLIAAGFTTPVTLAQLQPLVVKVLNSL